MEIDHTILSAAEFAKTDFVTNFESLGYDIETSEGINQMFLSTEDVLRNDVKLRTQIATIIDMGTSVDLNANVVLIGNHAFEETIDYFDKQLERSRSLKSLAIWNKIINTLYDKVRQDMYESGFYEVNESSCFDLYKRLMEEYFRIFLDTSMELMGAEPDKINSALENSKNVFMRPLSLAYWKLRQYQKEGFEVYYQASIIKSAYHTVSEYNNEDVIMRPQCGNNLSNPVFERILAAVAINTHIDLADCVFHNVVVQDGMFVNSREVQDIEFFLAKEGATLSLFGFSRQAMNENIVNREFFSSNYLGDESSTYVTELVDAVILSFVFDVANIAGFNNKNGYMPKIILERI